MTHDETRAELAKMDGWVQNGPIDFTYDGPDDPRNCKYSQSWRNGDDVRAVHPYEDSLDGANAAVPDGWTWERIDGYWYGWPPYRGQKIHAEEVPDTGNPMDDLYALALKCRKAMEESTDAK